MDFIKDDYRLRLAQQCLEQAEFLPQNENPPLSLDEHQTEAMLASVDQLESGVDRFSITHSGGAGKTILASNLLIASQKVKSEISALDRRDLLLVTERSIINGVREKLDNLGLDYGVWGKGEKLLDRELLVATIQSIQRNNNRLKRLIPLDRTDLVIGDEADLYLTEKRSHVVNRFVNAIKVGMSATMKWPDGRHISDLWGEIAHNVPLWESIERGIVVPPLFKLFQIENEGNWINLRLNNYDQLSLEKAYLEAEIFKGIPQIYKDLVPEGYEKKYPTLIYVPSVELVYRTLQELRKELGDRNIRVEGWTGELTSNDDLDRDILDLNQGKLDILVLHRMGGRGADFPRARLLIDADPTLSRTQLEQRHSRVLRKIRKGSDLEKEGFEKEFAVVAQVIPESYPYPPLLLPQLLDAWDDFQKDELLRTKRAVLDREELERFSGLDHARNDIARNLDKTNITLLKEVDLNEVSKEIGDVPQASENGFFIFNNQRYGTVYAWSLELGFDSKVISKKLEEIVPIRGKDRRKIIKNFYSEEDVKRVCHDLIERKKLPRANEKGYYEKDGIIFRTIADWERQLKTRNLKTKMKNFVPIKVLHPKGRVCDYYPQTDIDQISKFPKADADGFFEFEGDTYGTQIAWIRYFKSFFARIAPLLKDIPTMNGIADSGQVRKFFPKTKVLEACRDLTEEEFLPKANEEGVILAGGDSFRTLYNWSQYLGLSVNMIESRVPDSCGLMGLTIQGKQAKFFPASVVEAKLNEFLDEDLPKVNDENFFQQKGVVYRTLYSWASELGLAGSTVQKVISKHPVKIVRGVISTGRIEDFYPESIIKKYLKDFLEDIPQANEDGFFNSEGTQFGTLGAWGKFFDTAVLAQNRKKISSAQNKKGKCFQGHIRDFYPETVIKDFLGDRIDTNIPDSDENGLIVIDGKEYRTAAGWIKIRGEKASVINQKLKDKKPRKGKVKGRVLKFYSLSE